MAAAFLRKAKSTFTATQKKNNNCLDEQEKARRGDADKIARFKELRLETEDSRGI